MTTKTVSRHEKCKLSQSLIAIIVAIGWVVIGGAILIAAIFH